MADCRLCSPSSRITSKGGHKGKAYEVWVHLVEPEPDHEAEPPLDHGWHKRPKKPEHKGATR